MQVKDIIHPDDEKALMMLNNIPFFDRFTKMVMKYRGESYCRGENLGSMVQVTPNNLPKIFSIVEDTANEVGINVPDVYVYNDPMVNAYTYGENNPFIAISNSLIERMEPDEIKCIIAHECGHILCKHALYNTMVAILQDLAEEFSLISDTILAPIRLGLQYWSRKSELSADRCAAVICGEDVFQRAMLKLACGMQKISGSPYQLVEQAKQYLALQKESLWNRVQQNCRIAWDSHPQICMRAYEIDRWSHSPIYKHLRHE